ADTVRRQQLSSRALGPARVQIPVEDTGPVIPPEVLPTTFDPFVTTKGSAGSGLGLSISYGILRERGGHITAESRPGRGAIFTIELPVGSGAAGTVSNGGNQAPRLHRHRSLTL